MNLPFDFDFDFKNPDYLPVFKWRVERLNRMRKNPKIIQPLHHFYRENPAQFIIDWGCTLDPRNIERGLPATIPFLLFDKQIEWVNWFWNCWKSGEFCLTEKSRDMGVSWLAAAFSVWACIFHSKLVVGFGSRKEDLVDRRGDPNSLFYKVKEFIKLLPVEFRGEWDERRNSAHMRIDLPKTDSVIIGEAGTNIGRGGRMAFHFLDEAAHVEHAELIEYSLSQSTNCRCDISTPIGMANPFAQKRYSGAIPVFILDWRDHPAKDQEWYEKTKKKINNPVIIAQELDRDYTASMPGLVIPAIWVNAAIDAHITLNIQVSGIRKLGFDVADQGKDLNAVVGRYGVLIEHTRAWSGKGDDIFGTVKDVFLFCDEYGYVQVDYDADGLGAAVRGDARILNEKRQLKINFTGFQGSGRVMLPGLDAYYRKGSSNAGIGRTNLDFFDNRKAQGWWELRRRFEMTYLAVNGFNDYQHDEIISLSSKITNLNQLKVELSQPTYSSTPSGKIIIDKTPDGARSPNYADAVMIAFASSEMSPKLIKNFSVLGR